jgi:signal transduction histidine kinase
VDDTGPGISPEDRDRIFEPFEQVVDDEARTDSIHRGTGLGLTIAGRLARRLGGSLRVEDGAECGSTFVLRLPAEAPPGAR